MARQKKPVYGSTNGYLRKRVKGADGKYIPIYAKDADELTLKVAEALRLIEQDRYRKENPTVEDYANRWLHMHSANIRDTTLVDYTSCVKNYIIEPLGNMLMADVTADDVKLAMVKAGKQSESIYRKTQMLFKLIFTSALESKIITDHPCANLNPKGGKAAKEKTALTDEQVKTLLAAVEGLRPYVFIMLGLYAGLRREEALALQWDVVHLDNDPPYLEVCRAWHTEHNQPVIMTELKTKAAKRSIPIPPPLYQCLLQEKRSSTSDFVIYSGTTNGALTGTQWARLWKYVTVRMVKPRSYYRYENGKRVKHYVNPVLGEKAAHNNTVVYSINFDVTPHQLRHTYISNLLLAGVDVKTVQYLAGHENAKITLDIYTHLKYNQPTDLATKVNAAFPV